MNQAVELGVPHLQAPLQRGNFVKHFQIKDIQTLNTIINGNPISFTNVRQPFERLVSGYLMIKSNRDSEAIKSYQNLDLTFESFEQFVILNVLLKAHSSQNKKTFEKMNNHFKPTNAYCAFCNINYRVISKSETFDEDKQRIMEMAGLENKEVRLNSYGGDKIGNITRELFKNVTEDVKLALIDLYQYDFAMFEYDPDLY